MAITQRQQQAILADTPEEVSQRFYEALQTADLELLMRCWASDEEIICTMPSGIRVVGLDGIRQAFESILQSGPIRVQPRDMVTTESSHGAVHSVMQHVLFATDDGDVEVFLSATNVYHKTSQGWRLIAHHSSPAITESAVSQVEVGQRILH